MSDDAEHPVDEVLPFGQQLASLSDHQIEVAKQALMNSLADCAMPLREIKPARIRAAVEAALRAASR